MDQWKGSHTGRLSCISVYELYGFGLSTHWLFFLPSASGVLKGGQSYLSSKLWPGCLDSGSQMWKLTDFILKWKFSWLLVCWTNIPAKVTGIPAAGSTQSPCSTVSSHRFLSFLSPQASLSFWSLCPYVLLTSQDKWFFFCCLSKQGTVSPKSPWKITLFVIFS